MLLKSSLAEGVLKNLNHINNWNIGGIGNPRLFVLRPASVCACNCLPNFSESSTGRAPYLRLQLEAYNEGN